MLKFYHTCIKRQSTFTKIDYTLSVRFFSLFRFSSFFHIAYQSPLNEKYQVHKATIFCLATGCSTEGGRRAHHWRGCHSAGGRGIHAPARHQSRHGLLFRRRFRPAHSDPGADYRAGRVDVYMKIYRISIHL